MNPNMDEVEKQILASLLADFSDRGLTSTDLNDGYKGPRMNKLVTAICSMDNVTQVDFDIAFSDLERRKMVDTGPYEAYENDPHSGVIFIGGFSKREYAYLTTLGYKAARQTPNKPQGGQRIVNNVNISGGNFANLQLAAGDKVTQQIAPRDGSNGQILFKLVEILEGQGQVVSLDDRNDLVSAIDEATEGNGKKAKSLLEKVCGPTWEAMQPVIWPILGEIVKKSLDL
jgi:hypothetical protein